MLLEWLRVGFSRRVRRHLLMLFVPWALLIVLLAWLIYERLVETRLEPLLQDHRDGVSEGIGALNRHLSNLRGNVHFMARQPLLANVLEEPGPENLQALSKLFVEFCASSGLYDKIRWIDESGMERVRVDLERGHAVQVEDATLKNEAERYFFKEAMALERGTFYLSKFDLNEEQGVIEQPIKPTLRGAEAVFDINGNRRGILILNYLGHTLLERLRQLSDGNGGNLGLVDSEGYWMLGHPDDVWGRALGRNEKTLAKRFPDSWQKMQALDSGVFSDDTGLWVFSHFDPLQFNGARGVSDKWLLFSYLPQERLQDLRWQALWQVSLFVALMLGIGLVVVVRLALAEHQRDQARVELEVGRDAMLKSNDELQATVDQLQRTRRALLQAEKLSSLGTLVAGVAHELNTPIGAASMAASTLSRGNEDLQKGVREGLQRSALEHFLARNEEGLRMITGNLTRMAQLTRAFKKLASDRASTERRTFDLVELVHEVLLLFAPRLKQTMHRVELVLPERLWLDSYPGPLGQILQNLIENALVHAFEVGMAGVIRVHVERDEAAHYCLIEVEDDGVGMSEEVLGRIFDPFFTTRRGQGGTGLGLHITHQLAVEVLGGDLEVQSSPGKGTRFSLRLATD